jgi:hypothetical protein
MNPHSAGIPASALDKLHECIAGDDDGAFGFRSVDTSIRFFYRFRGPIIDSCVFACRSDPEHAGVRGSRRERDRTWPLSRSLAKIDCPDARAAAEQAEFADAHTGDEQAGWGATGALLGLLALVAAVAIAVLRASIVRSGGRDFDSHRSERELSWGSIMVEVRFSRLEVVCLMMDSLPLRFCIWTFSFRECARIAPIVRGRS